MPSPGQPPKPQSRSRALPKSGRSPCLALPAGPPVCVGMNIDIASIDMVSEVNMVSAALPGLPPIPCPCVLAHRRPQSWARGLLRRARRRSGAPGCLPPASAAASTRRVAQGAPRRRSRAEGASLLRKEGVLGRPSDRFRCRPRAPAPRRAVACPEASQVPARLLSNRRWGAGEEASCGGGSQAR